MIYRRVAKKCRRARGFEGRARKLRDVNPRGTMEA